VVPVVEHPAGKYDLIAVFVRTHQVYAVLESCYSDTCGNVHVTDTIGTPASDQRRHSVAESEQRPAVDLHRNSGLVMAPDG